MTELSILSLRRIFIELIIVVIAALFASQNFINSDPSLLLNGREAEWLTNSAYLTVYNLRENGAIPFWQPYLAHGEPGLDNPFSFALNPLSIAPSLIAGPQNGIKYSVVLYTIFAGIGGWRLARLLGLGSLARVLLGLIMIGRGNMHAEIMDGYFQLGVTMAYYPWVVAATLAIIRYRNRIWPVIFLAIIMAYLFWAGNVYHFLPAGMIIVVLMLAFAVKRRGIDWGLIGRVFFAGVLTFGLIALTLIPILAHQGYIAGHPDENAGTVYATPIQAFAQMFTSEKGYPPDTWNANYYSFVLPIWFVALILVIFPPIPRLLARSRETALHGRVIVVAVILFVFFLFWATGTNPIMRWANDNLPLIGQWRTLSRLLTVCSFWLALLAAIRVDSLWRAAVIGKSLNTMRIPSLKPLTSRLHLLVAAVLIVGCALAAKELIDTWFIFEATIQEDPTNVACIDWLRAQHPNDQLAVFKQDYTSIAIFMRDHVRLSNITADFHPMGMTPTLYPYDLRQAPSEYVMAFSQSERQYWANQGYNFVANSPRMGDGLPCLLQNPNTLSYGFTIPLPILNVSGNPLSPNLTEPITRFRREDDHIGAIITGSPDQPTVVVFQEIAWPGWQVTVDGAPAQLESVGQMIGVVLPPGEIAHRVLFYYDPPLLKLGGLISLATALLSIGLLLGQKRILQIIHTIQREVTERIRSVLNVQQHIAALRAAVGRVRAIRWPPRPLKVIRVTLELALIVVAALYASQNYLNSDPNRVLVGFESQWLTSSAYITADTFQREGRLSLWEPWIAHGEPAIENPFSFVLNPISTFPVLIYGAANGIKHSIVIYTILAGIGGWLLGDLLNLGWLGRLFLAAICIGRGNVPAELSQGYYQLSVTQFYFPWVAAATLAIIRFPKRRWPVVLLTITITLLFWAGNIYYTLPALIIVATLALAFMIKFEGRKLSIDGVVLRRVSLALLLSVGLAAATLLPIYAHQQYIGSHPNEDPNAVYESPLVSAIQFFTTDQFYARATWAQNYFSFILPFWFALLIFVVLPITAPRLHRAPDRRLHLRVYIAGLFLIALFFTWATKTNPIILWAYANLPMIAQWRVLSRMLTVAAFWIGVLAAMRLDGLWRALVIERRFNKWLAPALKRAASRIHLVIGAILLIAASLAALQLIQTWQSFSSIDVKDSMTIDCMSWLKQRDPTANLAVFGNDYYQVATYIEDHIRFPHINAEFSELGMTPTIYNGDLTDEPPGYLIAFSDNDRDYWSQHSYQFVGDSPQTGDSYPCLMTNPDTLPYAFSVPQYTLAGAPDPLPTSMTTPIWMMNRRSDAIGLIVNGDSVEPLVVVVQELAWPGWNVTVDGAPAPLESVGQMIGVVIPQGQITHQVLFYYDPPLLKIGGVITLITVLICAIYLMGGNWRILRRLKRSRRRTETV